MVNELLREIEACIKYAWEKGVKGDVDKNWIFYDERDLLTSFCYHLRHGLRKNGLKNCGFVTEFGFSGNIQNWFKENKVKWDWLDERIIKNWNGKKVDLFVAGHNDKREFKMQKLSKDDIKILIELKFKDMKGILKGGDETVDRFSIFKQLPGVKRCYFLFVTMDKEEYFDDKYFPKEFSRIKERAPVIQCPQELKNIYREGQAIMDSNTCHIAEVKRRKQDSVRGQEHE